MWPAAKVVEIIRSRKAHQTEGENNDDITGKKRLPILIFPGFMSSALEAKKSTICSGSTKSNGWTGKRIWLNIKSAGFGSLYFGGALKSNEDKLERGEEFDESLHKEYQRELECKNNWLQHLKLSDDLYSDPDGIQVRSLQGLKAIDYLVPGGLAKHVSWVFQPVIKVLMEVGYREGHDLDAAPYDWRLPPCMLESRDSYFSNTMKKVEQLYRKNDNTPVVLLCHSMGCKTCHYFLNFAKLHPEGGQAWLDQYIHTYFPVGGPHLGAPKSLRGTIVGDKMGLDAFLSEEEALIAARTFGSVPWMFPLHLPSSSPPIAYLRREGVLHVTVLPFDCDEMVCDRRNKPSKLRLAVTYRDKTLQSKFHSPESEHMHMRFRETFTFATSPNLPTRGDFLRLTLYEPGFRTEVCCKTSICLRLQSTIRWIVDGLFPAVFWRRCPCIARHETVSDAIEGAALATAGVATTVFGSAALLADSNQKDLSEVLSTENNPVECSLQLRFGDLSKIRKDIMDGKNKRDVVLGETSSIAVKVRVEWKPPEHDVDTDRLFSEVRVGSASDNAPDLKLQHRHEGKGAVQYEPVNGVQLCRSEYLPRHRALLYNQYLPDPIGPRALSSESPPPVKRVKAAYGIDLPTEVAAVYRRRSIVQEEDKTKCLHEMDSGARMEHPSDFQLKDGSIVETEQTPQTVGNSEDVVRRSGDGTVPYYSLQQCRKWQDHCQVEVHELRHAEHREILADQRFHEILTDYVTGRKHGGSSGNKEAPNKA